MSSATEQWFIDLKDIVKPALKAITGVEMVPSSGKNAPSLSTTLVIDS